jgi:hypothetical protein
MRRDDIQQEILQRSWNWLDMPDEETEGIIDRLVDALRPEVPHVCFEGDAAWSEAVGSIVVSSHPLPSGFHSDLSFWDSFRDAALYCLFGQFSSRSKVYQTFWNVFPQRHGELLRLPGHIKSHLPRNWDRTYGPYFEATAPTDECRAYEVSLHSAFAAEGFYYLPNSVLAQPSPLPDRSHHKDGSIGSALFGLL